MQRPRLDLGAIFVATDIDVTLFARNMHDAAKKAKDLRDA